MDRVSGVWAQVAEVDACFPVAQNRLITVRQALAQLPDSFDTVAPQVRVRVPKMMSKCLPGKSLAASAKQARFFSWVRAAWDRPCMTIQKSVTFGGFSIWHPEENRSLTGREIARLGSYPDAMRFIGSYGNWVARIGNSVPPLFMQAIAAKIGEVILDKKPWQPSGHNYPAILEEAWQQHLKPKTTDAPTVISLFAGCGGSSLGYSMAGYRELLAVEWDDNAVATFRLNFPDVPVYHGDICKLSVEECLRLAGIEPGQLDVLDGSPPCQGFSTAGKRNLDDDRNQLFREYVRLLRGLKPRVFVMENVSGLVKGKMKLVFAEIMRELKASGYRVKCRLMNAMYFNVPQSRERLIWIGVREDLEIEPEHPNAEGRPVTVREAIDYLPVMEPERHQSQVLKAWELSRPGKSLQETCRYVGSFQSVRLDPDKPSPTQIKAHSNWHFAIPRYLTKEEAAIIQGFPSSFLWQGKRTDCQERIGNSVPPLFMRAIAQHTRYKMLEASHE